jgi:poly(A) polymerase
MVPERFENVLAELAPLTERFGEAGHRLFLVGGTVRDLVLGHEPLANDFDATTDARPEVIKSLLQGWADAVWTQGERFGTIGAKRGTAPTRSPPTGPRRTSPTPASPRSATRPTWRPTCRAVTSR